MPNACYYHRSDLDGLCSAAIVKKFTESTTLFGMDYNDSTIPEPPKDVRRVYMVDFSLQPIEKMIQFADMIGRDKLIWIDHHKTAIEEAKRTGLNSLPGAREIGSAGCELTWKYFCSEPIPEGVRLLGRYDVWDIEYSDKILPFQYAMRAKVKNPDSDIWSCVLGNGVLFKTAIEKITAQGEAILEYVKLDNSKYLASCGFETEIEGLRGICLNRLASSQAFDGSYDSSKHDIMITFVRQTGKWRVSLFSQKPEVDCSVIAKKYGGGGHKGAAGFVVETLPFKI